MGLDRIRTRLLDLTNRNKLLNYRHTTASSQRVVDVSVDAVFRCFHDNERLVFLPIPEPDAKGDGASAHLMRQDAVVGVLGGILRRADPERAALFHAFVALFEIQVIRSQPRALCG